MLPKEGSRGRSEAEKPPVHGPPGYQPAITLGGSAAVLAGPDVGAGRSQRMRGRLGFGRLPDPALRRGEALLIGLPEPGQGDRADDGEAEPKQREPAQAGAGLVTEEHHADHGRRRGFREYHGGRGHGYAATFQRR